MRKKIEVSLFVLVALFCSGAVLLAQGTTAFTYQGQLEVDGSPADGVFDFEFTLYDGPDPLSANQVGDTVVVLGVQVEGGIFTVELDFGPGIFDGTMLWLETRVRETGPGPLTSLFPLQKITPVPYATFSVNSSELDGLDSTDFLRRTGGCQLCLGHADANGPNPDREQCVLLSSSAIDLENFLQFPSDVDENDRLWLWLECP